ncbi:DnaB-like helicase C-terminal domain-containing protein [Vulcanococcus sp.]|uniref:DnaB-like helicase C-terminal domain-containing protein n=1 Tax=Vulcanococcus sp. TaxID=2856995 RepID=UPI003BFCEEE5
MQQISEVVAQLQAQVGLFSDNDFRMAVDLLKSRRARSGLRQVIAQMERGLKADRPVEQVVAGLSEGVDQVRALVSGRLGTSHEFAEPDQIGAALRERMTRERVPTLATGIDAIDIDILGGVNPRNTGKLHVLAARTGVGKTTVAIAAAMGLTRSGADVLFLSCELEQAEIDARAFSNQAYANGFKCPGWILEGRGSSTEPPADFEQAAELWRQQTEERSIGRWMSKALFMAGAEQFVDFMHAAKAKNPRLSAVFIDHFHAMAPSKGFSNRSTEMEARALLLHGAAKACQVDLFLLAQLNRDACLAKRPSLEHINGTDAIAQLGSAVMLLEFPPRPEGAPFDPSQLVLYHGKRRNGQRRAGKSINVEESGLRVARETCTVLDCGLPFN